jgi:uncharacterized protein YdeI (YjbR/CyaY-like superfamily)
MATRDPRIDAYIDRKADFARPILHHLREVVHSACPQVEETLKWGAPAFLYQGEILAMMAAFKAHATFSFWKGKLVVPEAERGADAMGQFGRIASISDLPDRAALEAYVEKAMALTDAGVKAPRDKTVKGPFEMPADLRAAIAAKREAAAHFGAFSPSAQRDYAEWITQAKRPETRAKRVAEAVTWICEGKKRNWKYEKC